MIHSGEQPNWSLPHQLIAGVTMGVLAITSAGCTAETPTKRVECVVTQPKRVNAQSINGYPGNPSNGVFLNVMKLYGVSRGDYTDNFSVQSTRDASMTTTQVIQKDLNSNHTANYTPPLGDSDVITFCVTLFNSKKPSDGGHIWEFEPGTNGDFRTTAVTNRDPKWLRQADKEFPDTAVFVMDPSASRLTPLQP